MYTSGWQISEELTRRLNEMIEQQTHRSFPILGIDQSDPTGDDVKMTGVLYRRQKTRYPRPRGALRTT